MNSVLTFLHGAANSYVPLVRIEMSRQGDLPNWTYKSTEGADFSAWKTQWDAYLSLSGQGKEPQSKQVKALTLCFSRESITVVDNLDSESERQVKLLMLSVYMFLDKSMSLWNAKIFAAALSMESRS